MVADLGAADAAEKFLRPIRAGAVERIGFLVVDALHFEAAIQAVPRASFVSVDGSPLGDASANERDRLRFTLEDGRDRVAVTLANDDDDFALAILVT